MSEGAAGSLEPWRIRDPEAVPVARGEFEHLSGRDGVLAAGGWLHAPGGEAPDSFALYVGSALAAVVPPVPRPDVKASFSHAVADERLGFLAAAFAGGAPPEGFHRIHVVGFEGPRPIGRTSTVFAPGFADGLPVPPEHLVYRVSNSKSIDLFRLGGLRTAAIFLSALRRHADAAGSMRILDWGCGCGRVSAFFLKYLEFFRSGSLTGCDIDPEGVEWCARNLPGGRFVAIRPEPPMPFEDGEFDAICGYSVMTHLDRNRQMAWIRELKRCLRPGGLLAVSVHGESAARYAARRDLVARLSERGIVDEIDDPNLDGVAPEGYYRETYQSRAWTEANWGRELKVLEYAERGMGGFQDLVVLRKG